MEPDGSLRLPHSGATEIDAAKGTVMTRYRPARITPVVFVVLAALLGACSADPAATESAPASEDDGSGSTQSSEPEPSPGVFAADEPTLPGGVRVLSQDVDGFAPVEAGRHAVRVSESLLYQFDLPDSSEVFGGVYVNPGRGVGGDSIVYLFPAGERMALPVHPCRDHTFRVVGPTVSDLAGGLSRQPFLEVTRPVEVTVGGVEGLFVKATVPGDADVGDCQDRQVVITSDEQGIIEGPGIIDRMWILDIKGARHVLLARTFGATRLDTRLVTRLVESVTFTHG